MTDQSQPPPRAECDACGSTTNRIAWVIPNWASCCTSEPHMAGARLCADCNGDPSDALNKIRARRRSLQGAAPPAVHEFAVGDRVTVGETKDLSAEYYGRAGSVTWVGLDSGYVDAKLDGVPGDEYVCTVRLQPRDFRPAPSAQPESHARCQCGATSAPTSSQIPPYHWLDRPCNSHPSGDPYAEHGRLEAAREQSHNPRDRETLRTGRRDGSKVAQALRELSKPLPFGRDKYGQKLSLKGWPEDSEHEGMV